MFLSLKICFESVCLYVVPVVMSISTTASVEFCHNSGKWRGSHWESEVSFQSPTNLFTFTFVAVAHVLLNFSVAVPRAHF